MLEPKANGDFEAWSSLEPTLAPYLREMCGSLFLPWAEANAKAFAAEDESYQVELQGRVWEQKPVKYQVRSLGAIRKKYQAVSDKAALDPILDATGCLSWLQKS